MSIVLDDQATLEEIMTEDLVCQMPECSEKAFAISYHGPSPAEAKCSCLVCLRHYHHDRLAVMLAKATNQVGSCSFCGEENISPYNVYFREL